MKTIGWCGEPSGDQNYPYRCTRNPGHEGQHGYAGVYWGTSNPTPRQELMESLTDDQLSMMRLMLSTITECWGIMARNLTPRQKDLLVEIGKDDKLSNIITTLEEMRK